MRRIIINLKKIEDPFKKFLLSKKQKSFLKRHHISNKDFNGGDIFLNDCGKYLASKFNEIKD